MIASSSATAAARSDRTNPPAIAAPSSRILQPRWCLNRLSHIQPPDVFQIGASPRIAIMSMYARRSRATPGRPSGTCLLAEERSILATSIASPSATSSECRSGLGDEQIEQSCSEHNHQADSHHPVVQAVARVPRPEEQEDRHHAVAQGEHVDQ